MLIYYSGNGGSWNAEKTLKKEACVMLTFYESKNTLEKRFERLYKARHHIRKTKKGKVRE